MQTFSKTFSKILTKLTEPQTLKLIVILETITIVSLFTFILALTKTIQVASTPDGEINQAISTCLKLQPAERPACAKAVGMQIANLYSLPEEQIMQCMKLRPLLVRYCQEGLRLFSATPTLVPEATPTATPTEEATPTPVQEPTSLPSETPTPTETPTPLP